MANNPKIAVRSNSSQGVSLSHNGATQLSQFVQNTSVKFNIFVGNDVSDSILSIPFNGVTVSGQASLAGYFGSVLSNGVLVKDESIQLPTSVAFQKGIFVEINLNTSIVGDRSFVITVKSNDVNTPSFTHTFYYSVIAAATTSSDIAVLYSNQQIENNGIVDIGPAAKNSIRRVSFVVSNFGIPTLQIPVSGISLTTISGSETFYTNPASVSQVNLVFNETAEIVCNLDTAAVGEKSFVITIDTNDTVDDPFVFTVIYSVAESYELVIKENSSELVDEQTFYLGSVTQNSVVTKNITMSNSGILYSIRITNIVEQGNIDLLNVPALPVLLEPNQSNFFSFTCRIGTNSLGQKTGSAKIQWEVAL